MPTPYYALQPSFAGGAISPEVASRVDIEKFQSALLTAENVIIKPYGGVTKRPGSLYIGQCKYADKECILVRFNNTESEAYMLEVGYQYIRVWKNGEYLDVELTTPFEETDLINLRFNQSADTMFICSGTHPVQVLKHFSDTVWTIEDFEVSHAYYDIMTGNPLYDGNAYTVAGNYTFVPKITGTYTIQVAGGGGGYYSRYTKGGNGALNTFTLSLTALQSYTVVVGAAGVSGNSPTAGGTSIFDTTNTAAGGSPGTENGAGANAGNGLGGRGGYYLNKKYVQAEAGYVKIAYTDNNTITPSAISGEGITLTAIKDSFLATQVGGHIKLSHDMPSVTVSTTTTTSNTPQTTSGILVGNSWKAVSHGTWKGTITIQKSEDNVNWKEYRKYTGNDDFNLNESGTFDAHTYIRAISTVTSGTMYLDLTRYPYTHEGTALIKTFISATEITVDVDEPFGSIDATTEYAFGVWSQAYGYPSCSTFFQDRLVFAANAYYPHMIWMSRTGDYYNFGVEKVSGTLTDDSAVAVAVISREVFKINHIISAKDLIVLTNGNEWIVSGSQIVTPANPPNPMVQTTRGSNECEPQFIGNRAIYVQRRNGTVRDLGYTYESDNYSGDDLTQLAKNLVDGYDLTDSTFQQEPNSVIYFVRSDGAILCLTYIREQKVFGWSILYTDGKYESVANVVSNSKDTLYAIVNRTVNGSTVRYIEVFDEQRDSATLADYIMTDCSLVITNETATTALTGLAHLAGKTVQVIGDGRRQPDITIAADGTATIQDACTKVTVGLKYTAKGETPNVEMTLKDGTMQGRPKRVVEAYLRLKNSLGGKAGNTFDVLDSAPYDEFLPTGAYSLYTGDKKITLPGNYNNDGRVCFYHDEPYPFNMSAIIRVVNFG